MLWKTATLSNILPIVASYNDNGKLLRFASGTLKIKQGTEKARIIEEEVKKHPTALFFRAKAIKADEPNSNGDYFTEEELLRSYKTFEGVPFFTNHENENVENAKGKVIYAEWDPEEKSVYTISFIDREAYPNLCRSIEEEYIAGVSMGCSVEFSECNICGNKAEKVEDFCHHIRERKGRTFTGKATNVKTGETKEFRNHPVYEYNYGIKFIELSAVVDPACTSCKIEGLISNEDMLKKVANMQNDLYMVKTAMMIKESGQEELQQLNQALKTLEDISINLIQNRAQVEVDFASDLVDILSNLQKFVDELVGAGYGSVQTQAAVPGVAQPPMGQQPMDSQGAPPAMPVAEEEPMGQELEMGAEDADVGAISGAPGEPAVRAPEMPITAPAKPMAADSRKIQKIAGIINTLSEKLNVSEEDDMGSRRTLESKNKQKIEASKILSNSWEEKQKLFENICKVPMLQDNDCRLSVKKRDGSFVIVAESKSEENPSEKLWTYETLTDYEKELIQREPKEAASYFLNRFASELKINKKQGDNNMSTITKESGAQSVNKEPEVTTEKQLETSELYHSRTGEEKHVTTQKQMDEKRSGEQEVVTEKQLSEKSNKLNPRKDAQEEVVTEKQMETSGGPSPRKEDEKHSVTQKQLDGNRTNTEPEVVTEKQLSDADAHWARVANRDQKIFKDAGSHMKAVLNVMADTVISTGCAPEEATIVASSMVGSTKDRYELSKSMMDSSTEEDVDYSKRLAYWSKKNVKIAGVGNKEIAKKILSGLRVLASDETYNPEVLIDAVDVVSESMENESAITRLVDQKLEAAKKKTVRISKKEELRNALKATVAEKEDRVSRDEERKNIVSSVEKKRLEREAEREIWMKKLSEKENKSNGEPDTIIETDFDEIGCDKKDPAFKSTIKSFAKGALASRNIKLAAITNVTISGDTISIAVQTDTGEQSVELPIGDTSAPDMDESVPEGDVAGEGLEAALPEDPEMAPASAGGGLPTGLSHKKSRMKRQAQVPSGAGIPGAPGDVAAPGAPEMPTGTPGEDPVAGLTMDDGEDDEMMDEIPTAGEQQPPWCICPECGSADVDVTTDEEGGCKGSCQNCGAEYEAMVTKNIEFKIIKPTRSVGEEGATGAPEVPEVPALPVAAQTKLTKPVMKRIVANKEKHGHVCPACGMKNLKAEVADGLTRYACPACETQIEKDIMVDKNDPSNAYMMVKWDLVPKAKCDGCEEAATKFASQIKVQKMMKAAANSEFPMANCMERIARKYGGNSVASFGPCKGKPLADCVCGQLEKLGMTKVRHMERLASVYTQKDPMDACIEDQMKKSKNIREAKTICNCLKETLASKNEDNVFFMAFAEDIATGKEKMLTAQDLDVVNEVFTDEEVVDEPLPEIEEDIDMSEPLPELEEVVEDVEEETVTMDVSKSAVEEIADAALTAIEEVPEEVEVEVELEEEPIVEESPVVEEAGETVLEETDAPAEEFVDETTEGLTPEEEREMATAMKVSKILRVGEKVVKMAAAPKKVKDIEGNVEAGVPRSKATIKNESAENIDKPMAKPSVPRKDAYMGKEKEADSLISKKLTPPDVAVNSQYMGVNEKSNQAGMPGINNEIKGTVIAKKMKEVDDVQDNVDVPRSKATMGEEGKENIDVDMAKPDVPRAKATMGNEGEDNIDVKADAPDVPIDNAYQGQEKEVQKDMPGINDQYLKNVRQSKEVQLERLAAARRLKAVETAAKLLAQSRITETAYDHVIEALSKFEIDKIASVADEMYPKMKRKASVERHDSSEETYAGPAIIMESKEMAPNSERENFTTRLASSFTIGNRSFDENLTRFGQR